MCSPLNKSWKWITMVWTVRINKLKLSDAMTIKNKKIILVVFWVAYYVKSVFCTIYVYVFKETSLFDPHTNL